MPGDLRFHGGGYDYYYEANPYADIFWQAYLGHEAYMLFLLLRGREWASGCRLREEMEELIDFPMLAMAMGKSPHDDLESAFAVLAREHVIVRWVDRHGRARMIVQDELPLLTVSQIDKLPDEMQLVHDLAFGTYIEWGGRHSSGRGNRGMSYDEWLTESMSRKTFLRPFDPVEIEAGEVKREEEYWRTHPERIRRELTLAKKREILERDGRICRYCGGSANCVDHIIPVSQRGNNHPSNLAAACRPCNSKKKDRTPEQAGMTLRPSPQCVAPSVQIVPTV